MEVTVNNGVQSFNMHPTFFHESSMEYGRTAFSVTNNIGDDYFLYVVAGGTSNLSEEFGLRKYKINNSGITMLSTVLLDSKDNNFLYGEYEGYNLEIQDKNNPVDPAVAWILKPSQGNTKIFIYDEYHSGDDDYSLDLSSIGAGIIAGIEFSPFAGEEDYMFVSTENLGLIKIDWHDGTLIHQYTPSPNIDFSHTYVQTAPNGKVYAVSDDGTRLGELGSNNSFNNTAFTYPINNETTYSSHIDYKIFDPDGTNIRYFTLPENDKQLFPSYKQMLVIDQQTSQNDPSLADMTWNANDNFPDNKIMFEHGFRLTDGVTLNIDGMHLEFNQENFAKVIIEPGCKLIIDNESVLTSHHCYADAKWAGIEVWGDPSKNQDPISSGVYEQGYLEITDSKIENAETAIAIRKDDTWGEYGGGIVKATSTEFLNNAKSIHFAPYKNMFKRTVNQQTLEFEMQNECSFELCDFEISNNYFDDSKFFKHADIVQVHRIPFKGCDFIMNNNSADVSIYNTAIAAYSAGVHVDKASNGDPSTFTGFYIGVSSNHSTDNTYYHIIEESQFINNSVGIRNTNTNNVVIINNTFQIGENNCGKGLCGWAPGYGIDLRTATGFAIENNSFEPYTGITGDTYGIRIYRTNSNGDEIYNNIFNNLTTGNRGDHDNVHEEGNDNIGLKYYCNKNSNNTNDFYMGDNPEIHHLQGSQNKPAGNTFSQTAVIHLKNESLTEAFVYFFDETKPLEVPDFENKVFGSVSVVHTTSHNTCPDHYGGSGGIGLDAIGKQDKTEEFNTASVTLIAVQNAYNSLEDGGSTAATTLSISTAQANDTWELRAELLGMSPYLSSEVLKQASDKTEVLPESVLFEILSANPDELRKGDLMLYLENKEQPLPDYMINILRQMTSGVTAKTALLNQISDNKSIKIKAAQDIIRSILVQDEVDTEELRMWLANLENYSSDKQIIASYIADEKFDDAITLLNMLPSLYDLTGEALDNYNDWSQFVNMQMNWKTQGKNLYNLDNAELVILRDMADNANSSAKYMARGILNQFYNENFIDCATPENGDNKSKPAYSSNDMAKALGLSISAEPNPATVYTEFLYTLPYDVEKAMLSVFDMSGKLIAQENLDGIIGKKAFNTSNLVSGSYTYQISADKYVYTGKLIVQ